jgi:hypothetical protein
LIFNASQNLNVRCKENNNKRKVKMTAKMLVEQYKRDSHHSILAAQAAAAATLTLRKFYPEFSVQSTRKLRSA